MSLSLRHSAFALGVASLGVLVSLAHAGDAGFTDLFNGKDLKGWKTVLGKGTPDADGTTFFVKDGEIVVSGKPAGYFYTDKSYRNYVLKFDWKFIKDGNSGLLLHIQEPHKVWPKSLEIQGLQKDHGNVLPVSGLKAEKKVDKAAQKEAIKIGEWNTTEVTVKDGDVTTKINGTPVSSAKILSGEQEGPFGFQSEGTELHFKNIKIKQLP